MGVGKVSTSNVTQGHWYWFHSITRISFSIVNYVSILYNFQDISISQTLSLTYLNLKRSHDPNAPHLLRILTMMNMRAKFEPFQRHDGAPKLKNRPPYVPYPFWANLFFQG